MGRGTTTLADAFWEAWNAKGFSLPDADGACYVFELLQPWGYSPDVTSQDPLLHLFFGRELPSMRVYEDDELATVARRHGWALAQSVDGISDLGGVSEAMERLDDSIDTLFLTDGSHTRIHVRHRWAALFEAGLVEIGPCPTHRATQIPGPKGVSQRQLREDTVAAARLWLWHPLRAGLKEDICVLWPSLTAPLVSLASDLTRAVRELHSTYKQLSERVELSDGPGAAAESSYCRMARRYADGKRNARGAQIAVALLKECWDLRRVGFAVSHVLVRVLLARLMPHEALELFRWIDETMNEEWEEPSNFDIVSDDGSWSDYVEPQHMSDAF